VVNIILAQDRIKLQEGSKNNDLSALFHQSNANIIDERGLGKGKTYQANDLTLQLVARHEYIIRVLPRYDAIHEHHKSVRNAAIVAYGRTYNRDGVVMCNLCQRAGNEIAVGGLCRHCRENKEECRYKQQTRQLIEGNTFAVFVVPQMLPYILRLWRDRNPVIIIDDCDINKIIYPSNRIKYHELERLAPISGEVSELFALIIQHNDIEAENWIRSHGDQISVRLSRTRKEIIRGIGERAFNLKDINALADFLSICQQNVRLIGRGDGFTVSYRDLTLFEYRVIYQNATIRSDQRQTLEQLSLWRGFHYLDEKCSPNPHWQVIAIEGVKYTKRGCQDSSTFKEFMDKTLKTLCYCKLYSGLDFAEFSLKEIYNSCLTDSQKIKSKICHFGHYSNGISSINSLAYINIGIIFGTIAPPASFYDCYPYIDRIPSDIDNQIDSSDCVSSDEGNQKERSNYEYQYSTPEDAREITDALKEQEMGRLFRYDGKNEFTDKVVFIVGTAPRYEVTIDSTTDKETKYLPNSGAIVTEVRRSEFLKVFEELLRPNLEKAIVEHAKGEVPVKIGAIGYRIEKELGGLIGHKTIERILEKSEEFEIVMTKTEGNNKPVRMLQCMPQ